MRNRYLLWDHDGVLVDSERWYFEATRKTLARSGVLLPKETYLEFMNTGRSCWDLARAHGLGDREVGLRRAERDALYQNFLRTKPIEIEGGSVGPHCVGPSSPNGNRHDGSA